MLSSVCTERWRTSSLSSSSASSSFNTRNHSYHLLKIITKIHLNSLCVLMMLQLTSPSRRFNCNSLKANHCWWVCFSLFLFFDRLFQRGDLFVAPKKCDRAHTITTCCNALALIFIQSLCAWVVENCSHYLISLFKEEKIIRNHLLVQFSLG